MIEEKTVLFSAGPYKLEGRLAQLEGTSPRRAVVVCHPHPLYGGDMDNNVVTAVTRELAHSGLRVLRFNFRGVGASEGGYGDGVGELEDVRGAIDFLTQTGTPEELYLVGYSFGALVGLQVAVTDQRIRRYAGIAPPAGLYSFSFLEGCPRPKLLMAGEHDPFCPAATLQELFACLAEPKSLTIIPGTDHFFWGIEDRVAAELRAFLSPVAPSGNPNAGP